jgi:sporulation protein YlmC with PRC-barrel domain
MTFKTLTLSAATAALLATGAIAQDKPNTDANQPATPPAATQTAPAAPSDSAAAPSGATTGKAAMTDKVSGDLKFIAGVEPDQMLVSNVTGMRVLNTAGEELGDINDIVVNQSGKPAVAVIGVGGFLGMGEKDVGISFDRLQFAMNEQNERVVRLDATKETLEAAPSFVVNENKDVTATKPTN